MPDAASLSTDDSIAKRLLTIEHSADTCVKIDSRQDVADSHTTGHAMLGEDSKLCLQVLDCRNAADGNHPADGPWNGTLPAIGKKQQNRRLEAYAT